MSTIGEVTAAIAQRLAASGIAAARHEARLILAEALGSDPAVVLGYPERAVDAQAMRRLEALVARRARGEPISRLRGSREFWSLEFALSPDTLDPRPDSETLIEAALAHLPERSAALRVLDFGTGTGCLLLALLSELPNATGLGIDILPGAVATAARNAAALGLAARARFQAGDWGCGIVEQGDVILANPPYIPSQEILNLAPEVAAFEPRAALDGGADGLAAYRVLAPVASRLLIPGGFACVEVGSGQAAAVAGLLAGSGMKIREMRRDLAGIERCIVATL